MSIHSPLGTEEGEEEEEEEEEEQEYVQGFSLNIVWIVLCAVYMDQIGPISHPPYNVLITFVMHVFTCTISLYLCQHCYYMPTLNMPLEGQKDLPVRKSWL